MLSDFCVFIAGSPVTKYTTRMMDGSFLTEIFVPNLEKTTFAYTLRITSAVSQAYFEACVYITGPPLDSHLQISLNEVPEKLIYANQGDNETLVMQLSQDWAFKTSEKVSLYFVSFRRIFGGVNSKEYGVSTSDDETTQLGNMQISSLKNTLNNNVNLMLKGTIENFKPGVDAGVYCLSYLSVHYNIMLHISTYTTMVSPEQTYQWTPRVTMSSEGCNPCHSGDGFTILCRVDGIRNANITMFLMRANQSFPMDESLKPLDLEVSKHLPYMQRVRYTVLHASARHSGTYICTADSMDDDNAAHAEGQLSKTIVE